MELEAVRTKTRLLRNSFGEEFERAGRIQDDFVIEQLLTVRAYQPALAKKAQVRTRSF